MVFGDMDRRSMVRRLCETLAPACQVTEVVGATDAVLLVLGNRVDIVLVDAQLAGDLLQSLVQHVRRTSPGARVSVFGADDHGLAIANDRLHVEVLPWALLESTLTDLLRASASRLSDPHQ
jgi:DNA-binding NarL/FixJ family response regulator